MKKNNPQDGYTVIYAILRKCASAAVGFAGCITAMNCWILANVTERGWCVFWIFAMVACLMFVIYWAATPLPRLKRRRRR